MAKFVKGAAFTLYPDKRLEKELGADGFRWGVAAGATALTPAYLKQFNAVVLVHPPQVGTGGATPAIAQWADRLRDYVNQGGGLLVCGANNQDMGKCVRFQNLLV